MPCQVLSPDGFSSVTEGEVLSCATAMSSSVGFFDDRLLARRRTLTRRAGLSTCLHGEETCAAERCGGIASRAKVKKSSGGQFMGRWQGFAGIIVAMLA